MGHTAACKTHPGESEPARRGTAPTSDEAEPDLTLLVCPHCRSELVREGERLACVACHETYEIQGGIPNLQAATGFGDEDREELWKCEEGTGAHLVTNYMIPLLDRLFPRVPRSSLRLLSIGCGVGVDVELLNRNGFFCHGIDVGNRAKVWSQRKGPRRFTLAGVQRMPFRDEQFDFAFMNCVLPHVGVVGDTYQVRPDYAAERAQGVVDTIRVVKRGGYILLANPNRLCPLDLFHRHDENSHIPRFHSPSEPFLQSFGDQRDAFVRDGGCRSIETLPPADFWGFSENSKSSGYAVGRILQFLVKAYFRALSLRPLAFLQRTGLNPYLIVLVRR